MFALSSTLRSLHLRRRTQAPSAVVLCALAGTVLLGSGCSLSEPDGVAPSQPAKTTVKMDFFHKPLPEIPMPNDIATVVDGSSATGRRINASMIAPTGFESTTRELADTLDGWGIFQPITIPFTGPLDVESIRAGHRDPYYETANDVVYVINIDRRSPEFGQLQYVDIGNGNYPIVLERRDNYWDNDTRSDTMSILFDEIDEDVNHNGVLDPGEDTDADGVLDKPNYYPGAHPTSDDLAGRADAMMGFYERETNTLVVRLLKPLKERTVYAVVVTRRIHDADGNPVGSPFPTINHTAQTEALRPLPEVLPAGLTMQDVAFAFSFTTQSVASSWRAVREGLYGHGIQSHLGTDYPPVVDELLPMRDTSRFHTNRPYLLWGENWIEAAKPLATSFLGLDPLSAQYKGLADSLRYIDYFVIGRYQSPQLFPRREKDGQLQPIDGDGVLLPLNRQSWPQDLDRVKAPAYPETVYFTLAVPRKEVSVRGQGKPAPTVILSHGYGGNRFPIMQYAGYFARQGMATIAIDGPSHGIGLSKDQEDQARGLLGLLGYGALADSTLKDRAFDQDNDGIKDSGADFWTAYLFHTRDIVRQFALDYSQLVRIMRTWDGHQTWGFDLGNDGVTDIAGDFDGDGVVDVGGEGSIIMTGGSLGGIMSMIMGGAEPQITTVAPISGGAGYSDIGMRTVQGGAIEAFVLRMMGPLFTGTLDAASGAMKMQTVVPDLNSAARVALGSVAGVQPGDTLVAENLTNGARGCGLVQTNGQVRASLQCDRGDVVRLVFYKGSVQLPGETCNVAAGAQVRGVLDHLGVDVNYQGKTFPAGDLLTSIEDGLGRARNTPEVRRLQSFAQLILDPGDPVVFAPHLLDDPIEFPATGERTGAHALVLTSQGDMNVPASSGMTFGRAAGIIDFLHADPRYDRSENQMLIDTYTPEAVDNLKRFTDSTGKGVHLDVENFSQGMNDIWGPNYPRLDPPLHIGFNRTDKLGGKSAAVFTLTKDTGQHGFDFPGAMTDEFRDKCRQECTQSGGTDPCNCRNAMPYDVGAFLLNMASHYLATDGHDLNPDLCNSRGDCDYIPPAPPVRTLAELP